MNLSGLFYFLISSKNQKLVIVLKWKVKKLKENIRRNKILCVKSGPIQKARTQKVIIFNFRQHILT